MSFDPIAYAMAKAYSDSKGGYIKTYKKTVGYADELDDVGYATGKALGSIEVIAGKVFYLTTDSGAFRTVAKTITFDGETISGFGNVGKLLAQIGAEGVPDTGESFVGMILEGTLVVYDFNRGSSITLYEEAETVVPIKPEYLPGEVKPVVVDFDALGLTGIVLHLCNSGGGDFILASVEGGEKASEAMCKAFPEGKSFIAKLTVPHTGVMYVNPVYTLFDEYGFKSAHFDSYLENDAGLTKFYVRLYRNTAGATYDAGMVRVGFYQ